MPRLLQLRQFNPDHPLAVGPGDPQPRLGKRLPHPHARQTREDPPQFRRVPREVTLESGRTLTCWAYEYAGEVGSAALIRRGDYRRWLGRNG